MAAPRRTQVSQNGTSDSINAVFGLLLMLFLAVPIIEVLVIIEVAGLLGTAETVVLLVAISLVGAWLVKLEGLGLLARIQQQLSRGQMPTDDLVDGALVLVAGALMLTPGFVTDGVGLFLLVRPTRALARRRLLARFEARVVDYRTDGPGGAPGAAYGVVDVTDVSALTDFPDRTDL